MTSYISVVVKGSRFEAARAASSRAIPFVFVDEWPRQRHTVGRVAVEHRDNVVKWFCEPGFAPFPPGACLLYTVHDLKGVDPQEIIEHELAHEAVSGVPSSLLRSRTKPTR